MQTCETGLFIQGGWPKPVWITGGGNEQFDTRFLSRDRLLNFYVDPTDMKAYLDESNETTETAHGAAHLEMAQIAKLASEQKKPQEVIVFQRMFLHEGGDEETLNILFLIRELAKVHSFFCKYILGPKKHDKVGFKHWVKENFPGVEIKDHSGVPHCKGLKRKRE